MTKSMAAAVATERGKPLEIKEVDKPEVSVGTGNDLSEAFAFAAEGKVATHVSTDRFESINAIFDRMKRGQIDGRIVMQI